jgi:hypothetical protein
VTLRSFGGKTGPWGAVTSKNVTIRTLAGKRFRARLVLDHLTGLIVNVAWAGHYRYGRSFIVGWMPNHKKAGCYTGRVTNYEAMRAAHHRCWASVVPEFALGPDPAELRAAER